MFYQVFVWPAVGGFSTECSPWWRVLLTRTESFELKQLHTMNFQHVSWLGERIVSTLRPLLKKPWLNEAQAQNPSKKPSANKSWIWSFNELKNTKKQKLPDQDHIKKNETVPKLRHSCLRNFFRSQAPAKRRGKCHRKLTCSSLTVPCVTSWSCRLPFRWLWTRTQNMTRHRHCMFISDSVPTNDH